MESLSNVLFSLIKQALGLEETSVPNISEVDWRELLTISRAQAVSGLMYQALSKYPEGSNVPTDVIDALVSDVVKIEAKSRQIKNMADVYVKDLQELGLSPVIMKGPAVAKYYPQPDLRTPGDLDLYLPVQEMNMAAMYLSGKGYNVTITPDGGLFCSGTPMDVDLHKDYFDTYGLKCNLPHVPSPEAEILMLSLHILKHAVGPGVGLRQICDIAMAVRSLDYDKTELKKYFRATGTSRWNRLLFAYIREKFGIDAGLYGGRQSVSALDKIIFRGGNFGHHDKGRFKALKKKPLVRKADTAMRLLEKMPFAMHYAPRIYEKYIRILIKGNC